MMRNLRIIPRKSPAKSGRDGLTLFEVIVSLAIFVGSMAVIGQLIAGGVRGALRARLETQAVLRCESKLSEVIAGASALQQTTDGTFSDDPNWKWTLSLAPGPQEELFLVEVTVTHGATGGIGNVSYSLQRLMRDPQLFLDALAEEQSASSSSGTSGGSTTGSSGPSGSSSSRGSSSR